MNMLSKSKDEIVLSLSTSELINISNALNEVCHGLHFDEAEFSTRLGTERNAFIDILLTLTSVLAAPSVPTV